MVVLLRLCDRPRLIVPRDALIFCWAWKAINLSFLTIVPSTLLLSIYSPIYIPEKTLRSAKSLSNFPKSSGCFVAVSGRNILSRLFRTSYIFFSVFSNLYATSSSFYLHSVFSSQLSVFSANLFSLFLFALEFANLSVHLSIFFYFFLALLSFRFPFLFIYIYFFRFKKSLLRPCLLPSFLAQLWMPTWSCRRMANLMLSMLRSLKSLCTAY